MTPELHQLPYYLQGTNQLEINRREMRQWHHNSEEMYSSEQHWESACYFQNRKETGKKYKEQWAESDSSYRNNCCLTCWSNIWGLKCWLSSRFLVILPSIPGSLLAVCTEAHRQFKTLDISKLSSYKWPAFLLLSWAPDGRSIVNNTIPKRGDTQALSRAQPASLASSLHQRCDSQQAAFPASLIPPAPCWSHTLFYFQTTVTANTCSLRRQVRRRRSRPREVNTVACLLHVTCRSLLCSVCLKNLVGEAALGLVSLPAKLSSCRIRKQTRQTEERREEGRRGGE